MLKPRIAVPNHEEAFLQSYHRLRSWALQLVQNDQQLAEDLLHDVFLQFVVSKPDLDTIENLDGYLRTMLRNMHLSQLRRASRLPEVVRPLLDYDSASAGLETLKHPKPRLKRVMNCGAYVNTPSYEGTHRKRPAF